MKKFIIAGLVAAGASFMFSCNNGDYTAYPKSNGLNPLDPNSGVTVLLGSMKANIDGFDVLFAPVTYSIDTSGNRIIHGRVMNDTIFARTIDVIFPKDKYIGAITYYCGNHPFDSLGVSVAYSKYDTVKKVYKYYLASKAAGKGVVELNVKGDESGNMRGTLKGMLGRIVPEIDADKDSTVFSKAEFYVPKKETK